MLQRKSLPSSTPESRRRSTRKTQESGSSWPVKSPNNTRPETHRARSTSPQANFHGLGPDAKPSKEVLIAVMGATGSGKTSFINMASGSALRVGSGLMSCTDAVQTSEPFLLKDRTVRLIDTPGFNDTSKTDTEVLTMIAASLSNMYREGVKLSGAIYVHRISDVRMGGASTRNFKLFRGLCGDDMLQNVVIVTNMWNQIPFDVGQAREEELKSDHDFFKPVLDGGAQIKRHDNTSTSARDIVSSVAFKNPLPLRIQMELVDEQKVITETAAGAELGRELHEQAMRYEEERRLLQDEMNEALRQKDEQAREELEQATAQLNQDMMRVENERQQLASSYADEKERLEKRQQDFEVVARQEIERQAAEHRRRMSDIDDRLRHAREAEAIEAMQLSTICNVYRDGKPKKHDDHVHNWFGISWGDCFPPRSNGDPNLD
ncbi:G domain-containing protein [Pleurotus pulmonarius]